MPAPVVVTARGVTAASAPTSTLVPTSTPAPTWALVESAFVGALDALADVSSSLEILRSIDDDALVVAARRAAAERQLVDTHAALIAGEVARRSQHALGSTGLAQRLGYRTTEEFVRTATGFTARDAVAAVRVGRLLSDTEAEGTIDPLTGVVHETTEPWLVPVAAALKANSLSVAAAESIRNGLGHPSETITAEQLRGAVTQLCALFAATGLDADRLYRRAREFREELDLDAIVENEEARRTQRSLTIRRLPDGMTRLVWLMDPETAAIGTELYDRLTSPRGAGPRFVDLSAADQSPADQSPTDQSPTDQSPTDQGLTNQSGFDQSHADQRSTGEHRAVPPVIDVRSVPQLASDVFLELLRHGADADSGQLLGGGAPVVRVLVTSSALRARRGAGHIEGQTEAVSINTVERLACAGGTTEITFDDNFQPLNVGREQRVFTKQQRIALATRDGGCRFGDCERPPSWCEAHHIEQWERDHGGTDIANGILLCRHHHLLLHNNGWEINRDGAEYSLVPPPTVDATQRPRPMRSKSAAYRQLQLN